jgi:hypothetical protein
MFGAGKRMKIIQIVAVGAIVVGTAHCARRVPQAPPLAPPPRVDTAIPTTASAVLAGAPSLYPDKSRTPGAVNADITQATISQTICNPNWSTKSIRPPTSYTTALKKKQMADWGLPGTTSDYEEDHFISLELGGNPTDPRNLWPEPYKPAPGARQKDTVENALHKEVCDGTVTLQRAQEIISTDWYACYVEIQKSHPCR